MMNVDVFLLLVEVDMDLSSTFSCNVINTLNVCHI